MKLAVIGGEYSLNAIRDIAENTQLFAELTYIPNLALEHLPELVEDCQKTYDGILFSGTTPFHYASRHVQPSIPWEYLPRNPISFLCALLKAGYVNHLDIGKLSVDSYDEKMIRETYTEIGYASEAVSLSLAPFEPFLPDYRRKVLEFHIEKYMNGQCNLCLTGLDTVKNGLDKRKIPCIKINPSAEIIIQQVNQLRLRYMMQCSEPAAIAVLTLFIDFQEMSSFRGINELTVFRSKNAAKESVYVFAQHLGAASVETSDGHFILITTKEQIENETHQYANLTLFHSLLDCENVRRVFAAIGLGPDARTAQMNAFEALEKARSCIKSCMYIAHGENRFAGPIIYERREAAGNEGKVNKRLSVIAQSTGLGLRTLQQLEETLARHAIDVTTSAELSALMELTPRSINRIITKLEKGGYVEFIGVQSTYSSGRPCRLFRLYLNASAHLTQAAGTKSTPFNHLF